MVLSQATHCKFLGITIDESLSWKQQVSSINSKISRALFAIKQLKFSLPKESLLTLYFSLLHPYLTYGILAWGNASTNILRKTETLHKRALRTVHNKSYNSHTDPLFKSGILRVSDLYQLEGCVIYVWLRSHQTASFIQEYIQIQLRCLWRLYNQTCPNVSHPQNKIEICGQVTTL